MQFWLKKLYTVFGTVLKTGVDNCYKNGNELKTIETSLISPSVVIRVREMFRKSLISWNCVFCIFFNQCNTFNGCIENVQRILFHCDWCNSALKGGVVINDKLFVKHFKLIYCVCLRQFFFQLRALVCHITSGEKIDNFRHN